MDTSELRLKIINEEEKFYHQYWKHYISLEKKVFQTENYVTFCKDNYKTFSIEFDILLQAICSEIDVVAKRLCCEYDITSTANKMEEYIDEFVAYEPYMAKEKVELAIYNLSYTPWKAIITTRVGEDGNLVQNSPSWWQHYNAVKHRRIETSKDNNVFDILKENYKGANLGNVLNSLAALYILEKHCRNKMKERFINMLRMSDSDTSYDFEYPEVSIFEQSKSFYEYK